MSTQRANTTPKSLQHDLPAKPRIFSLRRFLLLLALALAVFYFILKATFFPTPPYSYEIATLPPANGKSYLKGEYDTKITTSLSFGNPMTRLMEKVGLKTQVLPKCGSPYFEDKTYNRYGVTALFPFSRVSGSSTTGNAVIQNTHLVPLRELKKPVEELTFHQWCELPSGEKIEITFPLKN